jgi:hypothetical protein
MQFVPSGSLALALYLLLALIPAANAQDAPAPITLMRLGYIENGEPIEVKVPAEAGAAPSPLRGKALPWVTILPGTAATLAARPADVVVDFYRGPATIGGDLLCSVRVRYFRNDDGKFAPRYQIYREPVVFRGPGGRWIPIESLCANPSLLKFRAPGEGNRDGFHATFEFGLGDRALRIDSWVVR